MSCLRVSTPARKPASQLRRWAWLFAFVALAATAEELDGIRYRVLAPGSAESAADTARRMLELLAEGKLDEAAAMSNAPQRRRQVLDDYLKRVGDAEFKRIFAHYASPPNRLVAEVAIGDRRLLVWQLAGAGQVLAGQYFVHDGERFVLDDVPNAERAQLGRVLQAYRSGKSKP
jgi:hypothetical protein